MPNITHTDTAPAPRYTDERAWIDQLKQGDEFAWEILVARYAADLRRAIQMYLRSEGLSLDVQDDVEAETWRTVVRRMREFEWMGEAKLRHWLAKIAHHHVQNCRRIDQQRPPSLEDMQGQTLEQEFTLDLFLYANGLVANSAEDTALLRERLAILDQALLGLSDRDREILLATLLDQTERAHLAQQYALEEDSISQIVWRAKQKLRAVLHRQLRSSGDDQSEEGHRRG